MYDVKILRTIEALQEYEEQWGELLINSSEHNIFQTQQMIKSLLNNAGEQLLVILISVDSEVVAVAPCLLKKEKLYLKFGVFSISYITVNRLRLLGDSIVVRNGLNHNELLQLILNQINSLTDKIDYLIIDNLNVKSKIWSFFEESDFSTESFTMDRVSKQYQELRGINLGDSYEWYLKNLTGKTRYNLRSRVKKLWKKGDDDIRIVKVDDSVKVAEFMGYVDDVYKNSWRAKLIGYHKRNTDKTIEQMDDIFKSGWLRSYVLLIKDKPISYAIGYQYNGVYLLEEIAYDKDWAKFGVGSVLNFKIIEDLFAIKKPEYVDFGYGENEYKRILGNTLEYSSTVYLIPLSNLKVRLFIKLQSLISYFYNKASQLTQKIGFSDWIKKTIKRRR